MYLDFVPLPHPIYYRHVKSRNIRRSGRKIFHTIGNVVVWSSLGADGFRVTKLEILLSDAVIALILNRRKNDVIMDFISVWKCSVINCDYILKKLICFYLGVGYISLPGVAVHFALTLVMEILVFCSSGSIKDVLNIFRVTS
jgi:hypothetical protein